MFVDDQAKAMVVSPEEPEGTQLLLEPNDCDDSGAVAQGIPATSFFSDSWRMSASG